MPSSLSSRALRRVLTVLLAAALSAWAGAFSLGGSASSGNNGPSYLALGDSVVFGYITNDSPAYVNPDNFIPYSFYAGQTLHLAATNAACPGQASGGFISSGGNDNGCNSYKGSFPLHASYAGTQLAFAESFLQSHPQTKLVTIGLGANDAFILQRTCTTQQCLVAGLTAMSENIDTILGDLRATGFKGVLMVVNYYSLDYSSAAETQQSELLNSFVTASAEAHGAVVADAFTAFKGASADASTCLAGLLGGSTTNPLTCDVHPSQTGQQLLAQTVVNEYRTVTGG